MKHKVSPEIRVSLCRTAAKRTAVTVRNAPFVEGTSDNAKKHASHVTSICYHLFIHSIRVPSCLRQNPLPNVPNLLVMACDSKYSTPRSLCSSTISRRSFSPFEVRHIQCFQLLWPAYQRSFFEF